MVEKGEKKKTLGAKSYVRIEEKKQRERESEISLVSSCVLHIRFLVERLSWRMKRRESVVVTPKARVYFYIVTYVYYCAVEYGALVVTRVHSIWLRRRL